MVKSTSVQVNVSSGGSIGPTPNMTNLVNYLKQAYIPALSLQGQGSRGNAGVSFTWGNGTGASFNGGAQVPSARLIEPNENLKAAYVYLEYGQAAIGNAILNTGLPSLNTASWMPPSAPGIPYHLPWNDEAFVGIPIPYHKQNTNVCFDGPACSTLSDGQQIAVSGACPVNLPYSGPGSFLGFTGTAAKPSAGLSGPVDEMLFQCMNYWIRGDRTSAQANLNSIAGASTMTGTHGTTSACVFIGGGSSARGIYLGSFLLCARVLNITPAFNSPITLDDVVNTSIHIQGPEGSFPGQYSGLGAKNGDPETTNVNGLAYCPSLIASLQGMFGAYNASTVPPTTFTRVI
jgi:hypothetical protein